MNPAFMILWIVLFVAFVIIEMATAQLVTVWFAVGSVFALISYFLKAPIWLECLIFVITSAIALVITRPVVRKIIKVKYEPVNADRAIGETAIVTETIDNSSAGGRVLLKGLDWAAKSEDDVVIPEGAQVTVLRIEGVKLIVSNKNI